MTYPHHHDRRGRLSPDQVRAYAIDRSAQSVGVHGPSHNPPAQFAFRSIGSDCADRFQCGYTVVGCRSCLPDDGGKLRNGTRFAGRRKLAHNAGSSGVAERAQNGGDVLGDSSALDAWHVHNLVDVTSTSLGPAVPDGQNKIDNADCSYQDGQSQVDHFGDRHANH